LINSKRSSFLTSALKESVTPLKGRNRNAFEHQSHQRENEDKGLKDKRISSARENLARSSFLSSTWLRDLLVILKHLTIFDAFNKSQLCSFEKLFL
jgi:hypothetical protein